MDRSNRRVGLALVCVALGLSPGAQATVIEHDVTPDVGTSWISSPTTTSDTGSDPIEEFTIFFDYTRFTNLSLAGAPSGWELSESGLTRPRGIVREVPEPRTWALLAMGLAVAWGVVRRRRTEPKETAGRAGPRGRATVRHMSIQRVGRSSRSSALRR